MGRELTLFVPVLNESVLLPGFLEKTVADLEMAGLDWELILVSDGGVDGSLDIMKRFAEGRVRVIVIDLGRNLGPGANSIEAYRRATKRYVAYATVDGFYDTRLLSGLLEQMDTCDVISAYRTDLRAHPPLRRFQTLVNVYLQRLLFPYRFVAYHTLQIHRRDFIQAVELESRTPFLCSEMLFKAVAAGLVIKEVGIPYLPRKAGKPTGGNPRLIAATLLEILRFWLRWTVLRRPMLPPGYSLPPRAAPSFADLAAVSGRHSD